MKKAISKKKASTKNVVGGSDKVRELGFWDYKNFLVSTVKNLKYENNRLWGEILSLQTAVSTLQSESKEGQ